jgi:hypothetical protein
LLNNDLSKKGLSRMSTHRVMSVEMSKARHQVVTAVHTGDDEGALIRRWTTRAVLDAMNRAERFYTQAANGRSARIQRYRCSQCGSEHIRTHISDTAIHTLANLPHTSPES